MRPMFWVLVARMEVSWNKMRCSKSTQCSATADLSECSSRMCHWCSFNLRTACLANVYPATLTVDPVHTWGPKSEVVFVEILCCVGPALCWYNWIRAQQRAGRRVSRAYYSVCWYLDDGRGLSSGAPAARLLAYVSARWSSFKSRPHSIGRWLTFQCLRTVVF
jgi:hypothetical protein